MKKVILFIGASGSGKGSRCEECKKHGYIHISSSELIEEAGYDISTGGSGIPDKIVMKLLREKISKFGKNSKIILEGFARRVEQAKLLNDVCSIEQVIYLKITPEVALKRVTGRLICSNCKRIYTRSDYKPPKTKGICDECGNSLIQRKSDTEQVFLKRYASFERNTYPVIEYYKNKGVCVKEIDAEVDLDILGIIKESVE